MRSRGARPLLLLLATSALIGAHAGTATACSCVAPDARAQYREADAAFVGVLENVRRIGPSRAVYRYEVKRSYKRRLGRKAWVRSAYHSATCGLPGDIGATYALFLQRDGRRWFSGLCSLTRPDQLRRAAKRSRVAPAATCPA